MEWFNVFGLVFMSLIMLPNIIYGIKNKEKSEAPYKNRAVEAAEQIGRYGCLWFMVFNIPGTWFGWWSDEAFAVYLVMDLLLIGSYCVLWVLLWKKNGLFKAIALSVIPAAVFLLSGIMSRSVLLTVSAVIFAPAHIFISCKNAKR